MTLFPDKIGNPTTQTSNSKSVDSESKLSASEQERHKNEKEVHDWFAHPRETELKFKLNQKAVLNANILDHRAQLKYIESRPNTEEAQGHIKTEIKAMESRMKELDKKISELEKQIKSSETKGKVKGSKLSLEG